MTLAKSSCESCRSSKVRCDRQVPSCQRCIANPDRGPCVYGFRAHPRNGRGRHNATKRSRRNVMGPMNRKSGNVSISSAKVKIGDHPASPCTHRVEEELTGEKASEHFTPSDGGIMLTKAEPSLGQVVKNPSCMGADNPRGDGGSRNEHATEMMTEDSGDALRPLKPFYEMTLPISLPSLMHFETPSTMPECPEEESPNIYQLLLVLSYHYVAAMLPGDTEAVRPLILRDTIAWENSFVFHNAPRRVSSLLGIRRALTEAQFLHTVSLEDLERQSRFCLHLLALRATGCPGTPLSNHALPHPPYRPFGVPASVALICYTFGVRAARIGLPSDKDFWEIEGRLLLRMAYDLGRFPLFSQGLSPLHLQHIFHSLQRAFQGEGIRAAATNPQRLSLANGTDEVRYYERAFLALDPLLLPRIYVLFSAFDTGELRLELLAQSLARIFCYTSQIDNLDVAFKKVPGLLVSKADRIVVTEMFHVKALSQRYQSRSEDQHDSILVFHVSM